MESIKWVKRSIARTSINWVKYKNICYESNGFEIKIKFDDEVICSDWIYLSQLKE